MGQEILYCFKCQERVTSADLDSSNALRFGNRTACRNCVPDLLASLSPEERKDLVSRVQSPKKPATGRFPVPSTPRPKAYGALRTSGSNQVVLWAIGGVVAALVIGIVILLTGSGGAPAPRESSIPPAPRGPEESPRDRIAREAIARAKSLPSSDPEAQLAAFEQAARTAEGTSRERDARELRDEFLSMRRKTFAKELAAVEERARVPLQKEEFGSALAIYDAVRGLHPGSEWKSLVDSKVDDVRKAVDALYGPLKDQAVAAKGKGAENDVKLIRERIGRWGLAEKASEFEFHLRNVQPPLPPSVQRPPQPTPQPTPPAPRVGGGQWVPIFDGKSLDFLTRNGEGSWIVENGGLAHVKERKASAQTKRQFADGDFRIRFKFRQASHIGFVVRQAAEGYYSVALTGADLKHLDDKEHEVLIFCRGSEVKAVLDDKPFPVEAKGASSKGSLQFNAYGESFVIKTLEFREPAELQSLVGHWSFDAAPDDNVDDSSGSKNDGKLLEGAALGPGRIGSAVQFDGKRARVSVPSSQSLTIIGPMTIAAWVNPGGPRENVAPAVVEKWDAVRGGGVSGYFLRLTTKGLAHFMVSEPAGAAEVLSLKPIPSDSWTFLTAVFEKGSLKMYVNGVLERTVPASASPGISRNPLRIGMGGGDGSHYFLGAIDDVRIYNRAISEEEIARLAAR